MLNTLSTVARVCSVGAPAKTGKASSSNEKPNKPTKPARKFLIFIEVTSLDVLLKTEPCIHCRHRFDRLIVSRFEATATVVQQITKHISNGLMNFLLPMLCPFQILGQRRDKVAQRSSNNFSGHAVSSFGI